jgi:hypothetical protein
VNGECVNVIAQFHRQRFIDHAMTLKPALAIERIGHDMNTEVAFAVRRVAAVARVQMRFVDNVQALRRERLVQLFRHSVGHAHAIRIAARVGRRQYPVDVMVILASNFAVLTFRHGAGLICGHHARVNRKFLKIKDYRACDSAL